MRFYLIIFCGIAFYLSGCNSRKEAEHAEEQTSSTEQNLSDFDPILQKLLGTDTSGAFRGISLGQSKEKVKVIEASLPVVNESDTVINYTINFTATEEADLLYFFTPDNKLKKIEADIYPPSEENQSKLFKQLESFYSARYGASSVVDKSEVIWNIKEPEIIIILKKTGNEKVHDLQLDFVHLAKNSNQ